MGGIFGWVLMSIFQLDVGFFHINLMSPNYPGNVVQLFSVIWVVACCHSHSQVAKILQTRDSGDLSGHIFLSRVI